MASPDDKDLGRFYTPPRVAQLALAEALGDRVAAARTWDPTCGDGGFLVQAAALGVPVEHLHGHDIDAAALGVLRQRLPGASLQHADLFELEPADLGLFDAIAGNPPYVRQERLGTRRRALADRVGAAWGIRISSGLDLSVLALLHCLRFLAPGGRLAFVLPSTFLDTARAAPARAAILERFALRAVIESRADPWFTNASVNTVIAVFAREEPGDVTFRQLGQRERTVPQARLGSEPRWSPFLRAPDVWFEALERHAAAFVRPASVLKLAYGTKPGISAFFAPRDPQELADVEPRCLRPFLRSLRGVDGYRVRSTEVAGRLFVVQPGPPPTGAAAWIASNTDRRTRAGVPFPDAPSIRNHRPWWRLPEPASGTVLVPQFRAARHHVIDNPDRVLVNNSAWWGRWLDPSHHDRGVALLNTSWMALAAEVLGRVNLGEGLLTLYGPELADLPLLDPRPPLDIAGPWARMRGRTVLPFLDEVDQPDRQALDHAALAGVGVDPALAAPIRAAAAELLATRLALARERQRER